MQSSYTEVIVLGLIMCQKGLAIGLTQTSEGAKGESPHIIDVLMPLAFYVLKSVLM